jgi:hypothetical protein
LDDGAGTEAVGSLAQRYSSVYALALSSRALFEFIKRRISGDPDCLAPGNEWQSQGGLEPNDLADVAIDTRGDKTYKHSA